MTKKEIDFAIKFSQEVKIREISGIRYSDAVKIVSNIARRIK